MSTTTAKRAQVAERRARAVELRTQRHTWQQVANLLGYASRGAACADVGRALDARLASLDVSVDALRRVEVEHLDELERECWAVLEADHPTVSHGRVVLGGDGTPLPDYDPILRAVDRLLRIIDARARLNGLYRTAPIEAGVTVRYEIPGIDPEALR